MVRPGKNGGLHLKQISYYKRTGEYHPSTLTNERSGIRRAAKKFIVKEKKLFYVGKDRKQMRLAVVTEDEKKKVLTECHENTTGMHHGISRTLTLVEKSYYWTSITSDVKKWVHDCRHCQLARNANLITSMLHSKEIEGPWSATAIQLLGPFNATPRKHMYVSLITDLCTQWVMLIALCGLSASEIAKAIVDVFYLYGPPKRMMIRQEKEVILQINREIHRLFGLKDFVVPSISQSDHPHDGTSKMIKVFLGDFCRSHPTDWDGNLSAVAYAFNSFSTESDKRSPHLEMFHRYLRVPETSSELTQTEGQSISRFTEILAEVRQARRQTNAKNGDWQEQMVNIIDDQQHSPSESSVKRKPKSWTSFPLKVGHEVLRQRKNRWKDGRFQSEWIGPCVIDYITDNGCALLRDSTGCQLKRPIKMSHLKPFVRGTTEQDGYSLSHAALVIDHDYIGFGESSMGAHQQYIVEEEVLRDHSENEKQLPHKLFIGDKPPAPAIDANSIQVLDTHVGLWSEASVILQSVVDGTQLVKCEVL